MEIGATDRTRSGGAVRTAGAKRTAQPSVSGFLKQNRSDRVALSSQALAYLEEHDRQMLEEAERSKSQDDALLDFFKKAQKELENCLKIASRIMAGDKVPPEDEQYLMLHDSAGYRMAMAMRKPKERPKEHDSVLSDEEKEQLAADLASGQGTQMAAASKSGPV